MRTQSETRVCTHLTGNSKKAPRQLSSADSKIVVPRLRLCALSVNSSFSPDCGRLRVDELISSMTATAASQLNQFFVPASVRLAVTRLPSISIHLITSSSLEARDALLASQSPLSCCPCCTLRMGLHSIQLFSARSSSYPRTLIAWTLKTLQTSDPTEYGGSVENRKAPLEPEQFLQLL